MQRIILSILVMLACMVHEVLAQQVMDENMAFRARRRVCPLNDCPRSLLEEEKPLPDITESAFSMAFETINNVAPDSVVPSNSVFLKGLPGPMAVSVSSPDDWAGVEFSLDDGKTWSTNGMAMPDDFLMLRMTSSKEHSAETSADVVLGGWSAVWHVVTSPADFTKDVTEPDFVFAKIMHAIPDSLIFSNSVDMTGLPEAMPVVVTTKDVHALPQVSTDGGMTWDVTGTVAPGSVVQLRAIAPLDYNDMTTIHVILGGAGYPLEWATDWVISTDGGIRFTTLPVVAGVEGGEYQYLAQAVSDFSMIDAFTMLEAPDWMTLMDNADGSALVSGMVPGNGSALTGYVPPIYTDPPLSVAQYGKPYSYHAVPVDYDANGILLAAMPVGPKVRGEQWAQLIQVYGMTASTGRYGAGSASGGWQIYVNGVPPAYPAAIADPQIVSVPVTTAYNGTPYSYEVQVDDADSLSILSVTVLQKPSWLQLYQVYGTTASTGRYTKGSSSGSWKLYLRGVPPQNPSGIVPFGAGHAPRFISTPATTAERGGTYTYEIAASDADAVDVLNLSAPTLPSWLTLTWNGQTNTGTLAGTAPASGGAHEVSLLLRDASGAAVFQNFVINIP